MKIVIATGNRGKLREITAFLKGLGIDFLSLVDFPAFTMPPETGGTFKENALIKARAVSAFTGLPALADDSGLEVDFLNGAPGIYSARYAAMAVSGGAQRKKEAGSSDGDNINRLLHELKGVPAGQRTARFRTVIALVVPGSAGVAQETFNGVFNGRITEQRSGTGGFGYDPVFYVEALGMVAAELTVEKKGEVSHRGMALKELKEWLCGSGFL